MYNKRSLLFRSELFANEFLTHFTSFFNTEAEREKKNRSVFFKKKVTLNRDPTKLSVRREDKVSSLFLFKRRPLYFIPIFILNTTTPSLIKTIGRALRDYISSRERAAFQYECLSDVVFVVVSKRFCVRENIETKATLYP